jgi:hypothetical protein
MPRHGTTYVTRNPINFTNEEVATLRAIEQLPSTATKAEIKARAQHILDQTKKIARKDICLAAPQPNAPRASARTCSRGLPGATSRGSLTRS